jgi:hypothetical protein
MVGAIQVLSIMVECKRFAMANNLKSVQERKWIRLTAVYKGAAGLAAGRKRRAGRPTIERGPMPDAAQPALITCSRPAPRRLRSDCP